MSAAAFLYRAVAHGVAGAAIVVLSVMITVVVYFGLFAVAAITGSGLGGPLALPGMVLLALVGSMLTVIVVLLPATVLAEFVCRRYFGGSRWLQIPFATGLSLALILALSLLWAWLRTQAPLEALKVGAFVWATLLVPLAIYWWIVQAHDAVRWLALRLWARFRRTEAT